MYSVKLGILGVIGVYLMQVPMSKFILFLSEIQPEPLSCSSLLFTTLKLQVIIELLERRELSSRVYLVLFLLIVSNLKKIRFTLYIVEDYRVFV